MEWPAEKGKHIVVDRQMAHWIETGEGVPGKGWLEPYEEDNNDEKKGG